MVTRAALVLALLLGCAKHEASKPAPLPAPDAQPLAPQADAPLLDECRKNQDCQVRVAWSCCPTCPPSPPFEAVTDGEALMRGEVMGQQCARKDVTCPTLACPSRGVCAPTAAAVCRDGLCDVALSAGPGCAPPVDAAAPRVASAKQHLRAKEYPQALADAEAALAAGGSQYTAATLAAMAGCRLKHRELADQYTELLPSHRIDLIGEYCKQAARRGAPRMPVE